MMGKSLRAAFTALALCLALHAQRPYVSYKVMLHAVISHKAGFATLRVASAGPLYDAVLAVAQEYGWVVDYEDPPYTGTDLAIHPSPRPGIAPYTVIAGGPFQCAYPETPHMWSSRTAEPGVLQKIVSDYNSSGNPGQFKVLSLPDGNFDVVGVATHDNAGNLVPVKPLLDTLVSIPTKPRTLRRTLRAIADALPAKVQILLGPAFYEGTPNPRPTVAVGGTDVPARELLMEVADQGEVASDWTLGYQPGPEPTYVLSIRTAWRAEYDMTGNRTLVPILKSPR
jgi:hypothetical protein